MHFKILLNSVARRKKLSVQFSRSAKLFLFAAEVSALAFFVPALCPQQQVVSGWLSVVGAGAGG